MTEILARAPSAAAAPSRPSTGAVPRWLRHGLRVAVQLILDAAAVWGAYWIAYQLRFHWQPWVSRFPGADPGWDVYVPIVRAFIPVWLGLFWYSARLYTRPWMRSTDRFLMISKAAFAGGLITLAGVFIYGRLDYSRQALVAAIPVVVLLVTIAETIAMRLDRWIARFEATSPVLLIGGGRVAELIRQNLLERHPGLQIHERALPPAPEEAAELAEQSKIGEIIIARWSVSRDKLLELAEACESSGINFKMIPDVLELRLGEIQMDHALGLPAYRIQHTSLSASHFLAKRCFDLLISCAVLLLTSVPLAFIALLIKLDSKGPVFFRQKRLGYKGKVFEAFKFRTMIADAEAKLGAVKTPEKSKGGFFKAKEDPRITRVGRWLRRYSLDEFPQFINVARGEMSVVGPRPLAVTTGEVEALVAEFGATAKKRLNILPGITGLWQVSGRSDVSPQQRFALDMFYIEHWSLGLDLQIIFKTIPAMISGKGAY